MLFSMVLSVACPHDKGCGVLGLLFVLEGCWLHLCGPLRVRSVEDYSRGEMLLDGLI